jgi:hypothetical protein
LVDADLERDFRDWDYDANIRMLHIRSCAMTIGGHVFFTLADFLVVPDITGFRTWLTLRATSVESRFAITGGAFDVLCGI